MSASQQVDAALARLTLLFPKLIDLSLDRMHRLLADLGHPEQRLPPVIHVAGTNGKGSTVATMRAVLEASGYKVHVYTSPHLVRFAERIRLVGDLIDEALLLSLLEHVEEANAGKPITFFEVTTAVAFLAFARIPADITLLEVGLGGRFDATNVVAHPKVTVLTSISMDHMQYLGNTLAAIQELSRTVIHRKVSGTAAGRVRLDVAGYRQRRREALEQFTRGVAEEVRSSGVQKALEPMGSADRKVVHDAVNEIEGVSTISEGDEPRRRVVLIPS